MTNRKSKRSNERGVLKTASMRNTGKRKGRERKPLTVKISPKKKRDHPRQGERPEGRGGFRGRKKTQLRPTKGAYQKKKRKVVCVPSSVHTGEGSQRKKKTGEVSKKGKNRKIRQYETHQGGKKREKKRRSKGF